MATIIIKAKDGMSDLQYDHPLLAGLGPAEIDSLRFGEEWDRAGLQTFDELEPL